MVIRIHLLKLILYRFFMKSREKDLSCRVIVKVSCEIVALTSMSDLIHVMRTSYI